MAFKGDTCLQSGRFKKNVFFTNLIDSMFWIASISVSEMIYDLI